MPTAPRPWIRHPLLTLSLLQRFLLIAACLMMAVGSAMAEDHVCGPACGHAPAHAEAADLPWCDGEPPDQGMETFAATLTMDHFLAIFSADSDGQEPAQTVPASGDVEIDALRFTGTNVYRTNRVTQITYSFYSNAVHGGNYYGNQGNVHEVSTAVKNNFRDIFGRLNQILDINFVEVTETNNNWGQIRIMYSDGPNYAYAYYPTSLSINNLASDIHLNPSYTSGTNSFGGAPGTHGYMSLVHELGHALGLKHPHEGTSTMPSDRDNTIWTSMSYNFSGSRATTFMALDVKFLHYAYDHAISTLNEGDTTIRVTNSMADRHDQNGQLSGSTNIRQALFNPSGNNTLDLSGTVSGTDYTVDLNPRGWIRRSSVNNLGIMLTDNTVISRVLSGPGNDALYASSNANVFAGYAPGNPVGNDVIHNASSGDTIDLGLYSIETCIETIDGDDALFTMAGDGSVRVVGYWALSAANRPTIIRPPTDGTVQFASPIYSVNEGDGSITITVTRSGSDGAVTVDYATANGSALAGTHYTATSGTLSWANGDDAAKTFTIPIIDNLIAESDDRSFTIILSNADGAVAHTPNTTTVTIIDNNHKPIITFNQPNATQVGIPSGVGLILDAAVTVDAQQPGIDSITWSVLSAPGGASVTWDSTSSLQSAVQFSHDGDYLLRLRVSDGTNQQDAALSVKVGGSGGAEPPGLNLAAWLRLDESGGSTASDSSGNDRDGAVSGSPTWRPDDGRLGGALRFTADSQRAVLANSNNLDNTAQMSWSMWLRPDSFNSNVRGILSKRSGASSGQAWSFFLFTDNTLTFDMPSSSNRLSIGTIPANEWTHVTAVFDGSKAQAERVSVYINGTLSATYGASITSIPSRDNSVTLGTLDTGDNRSFRGDIDEVLIYHGRALSAEDAAQIYENTGNQGPAVAISGGSTTTIGAEVAISGSIDDDGLPANPGSVSSLWLHHAGPGNATFADATAVSTTVTLDHLGTHTLRLLADDGEVTTFAEHEIEVISSNPAGTLVMELGSATVAEDAGSISLLVRRIGGSDGSVALTYSTSDGSALAGTDYTASGGTLSWADGDSGDKTITVPILINADSGDDSVFTVSIFDVSGDADLGSPSSTTVTIRNTVYDFAPIITSQPQSMTVVLGQAFTLSVSVDASPQANYQWHKDASPIAGATDASYTVASATLDDAGDYWVTVSNSKGSVDSATATVIVNDVDPDLIAWWKLDDGSGSSASDSTGNGHDGSLEGLDGSSAWANGRIGGALDFDGSGFVDTGKTADQLGVGGNAARTVTLWARTRAFNNGALFQVGHNSSGSMFALRTLTDANRWRIQYWGGDEDFDTATFGVTSLDRWVHFAQVYANGQTLLYINGVHRLTFDREINTSNTTTMRLGQYFTSSATNYQGTLDDVRLYGRALSSAEIETIYNAGIILRQIVIGIDQLPNTEWLIDPEHGSYGTEDDRRRFSELDGEQEYTLTPLPGAGG